MITSLTKLTMRDYVSLVCGDTDVLHKRNEVVNPDKLAKMRLQLMFEFSRISDEAGAKGAIHERKDRLSNKAELTFFKVCHNLIQLGAFAEVRDVLAKYGIDERRMTDEQVSKEVERLLRRCETESKRQGADDNTEAKAETAEEIRGHFDKQAAMLMTYFKFQIDLNTVSASQFACMIDQASKEIKAKMTAMNNR